MFGYIYKKSCLDTFTKKVILCVNVYGNLEAKNTRDFWEENFGGEG
jgi:hypothetical protein